MGRLASLALRLTDPAQIERTLFALSKIVGLVVRPLILLIFLRTGQPRLGEDFSLLLTATASSFIILNNQNFRVVYQYFLDRPAHGGSRHIGGADRFQEYVTGTWIHLIAFLGVAAAVLWAWIGRWDLFVLAMAVIIFEKYFDDDQRVLVYKKLYYQWIMNFSARIIFPSIVLVVAVVIFGKNSVAYYVAAEAAGMTLYVLCYQTQFFRASYRVVRRAWRLSRFGMFRQYAGNYVKEYSIAQIWSFLTINCIMVDRFFVNMQSPSIFAEYIFAVNLANTIQTFHNLGYVSFLRPHLMKASTSGMSAQFAPMNFLVPLALTAVMLIVFHGSQAVGYPLSRLDAPLFWGVCGLYFLHAVSLVVKELAFWRLRRGVLLAQELVVYVFPVAAYLAGATSPSVYVMSALAGVAMRFGILILLVRRAEKPGSRLVIRSAFH